MLLVLLQVENVAIGSTKLGAGGHNVGLVDNGVLDLCTALDGDALHNNGVADGCARLNDDVAAKDGALNAAVNAVAGGDEGVGDLAARLVLCRRVVVGLGLDRTSIGELGQNLRIKKVHVRLEVGSLVEDRLHVAIELSGHDAEAAILGVESLEEIQVIGSCEGVDEPVAPIDWNLDGEVAGAYSFTFTLPGEAKLQLNGMGYTDVGSYTLEPESIFLEGRKENYEITFTGNKLEITPLALTITASASKEYDGEPLVGSDAVNIEGLADGDIITVTATGTITDAGTTDNPYTIDWGNTNPNNYTLTEEPGLLEVTPKKVTLTTGSTEKLYDGETLFYNNYELSPSDPWVNGQAPKITVTGSITNAGIKSNTCMVEWKGVNPNNYDLKQELGTLTVKPVEIVLIQDCAFGVAGNVTIESYGLKVQVSDVNTSYYDVPQMGENRWWLQFAWGDKIEVQIAVVTDETSYTITPVYDFVLGDSGNYKINTVDATGEFDVPPVAPLDGFSMGRPAGFSSVDGSSLNDGEASPAPAEVAPAGSAPAVSDAAPAESAPAELSREEDQADEDALEEPTEDEIEQAQLPEEEPQEEPSEEEPQKEPSEEEPQEEPSEEEPSDKQGINT